MATTYTTLPLDGTTREFTIPFEYLTRRFVTATLIGTTRKTLVLNVDFRFVTPTKISTTVAWGPADGYDTIELRRATSASERLVDFNDGSILRASDLNISQVQAIHIAEEGRDISSQAMLNNLLSWDALNLRIRNLADPISPQDAATKNYVDSLNGVNQAYLEQQLGRTVRGPTGETINLLPPAALRASKLMAFDALGNPMVATPQPGSYAEFAIDLANTEDFGKGIAMIGRGWQSVNKASDLRKLLKSSSSKYAQSAGYWAPGDGGHGLYYLDLADTTSPDNAVTVWVATDGGRWKLNHNGRIHVKQGGARCDNTTNDQPAVQRVIDSLPKWPTQPAGGVVEFTAATMLSSPVVAGLGVRFEGDTGNYNTFIRASGSFVGEAIVIFRNTGGANYTTDSIGISRIRIACANQPCHGVVAYAPRDNWRFSDVFIDGTNGAYSAMKILGTLPPNLNGSISQSGIIENCTFHHEDGTATAPTFYGEGMQECTFINMKCFGAKANLKANSIPIVIRDSRGVSLVGCTSAFSNGVGIRIETVNRFSTGITITGHTFEGTDDVALECVGVSLPRYIQSVALINPRYEGTTPKCARLTNTSYSTIEGISLSVECGTGSQFNRVIVKDQALFINSGGLPNSPTYFGVGPKPWTVTNPGALRSFDTATITHLDLAKAFGSAIQDLKDRGIMS